MKKYKEKNLTRGKVKPCQLRTLLKHMGDGKHITFHDSQPTERSRTSNRTQEYPKTQVPVKRKTLMNFGRNTHGRRSLITKSMKKTNKLDGERTLKKANFYFQNHPTCLKVSDSDS